MIDEKTFDSINKKKKSNRNYGNAEAMADLLRMRFEPKDRDEGVMLRAIEFFSTHIFAGKVSLKQKGELIPLDKLAPRKKATIATELIKETTVSSLNNATLTGSINQDGVVTNKIECQFQFTGEMEKGVNTSLMYDLKKDLTAAARDLGSIDIQNILFYIRRMDPKNIGMSEQEVIDHLFLPDTDLQNTSSRKRTPQEEKEVKAKLSLTEQVWR